jgi:hypothetical protein
VVYFGGFFPKLEFSRGFLYISLITSEGSAKLRRKGWGTLYFITLEPRGRVHILAVNFSPGLFYILFAVRISEVAMGGGGGTGVGGHYIGRKVSVLCIVPEFLCCRMIW